jgi:hypothetical protein
MPQYLLNIIVGVAPPPEALEPVLRDLASLNEEMRSAGVRVFAAALPQPETTTVVGADGDTVRTTDGSTRRAGVHRRLRRDPGREPRRRARLGRKAGAHPRRATGGGPSGGRLVLIG